MKRALSIVVALALVAASGFAAYGWWTRRGTPSFSEGGAFGAASTPPPAAQLMTSDQRSPSQARTGAQGSETTRNGTPELPGSRPGSRTTRESDAAGHTVVSLPSSGRYVYDGAGREEISFGPTQACAWDVDRAVLDVKGDGRDVVYDWRFHDNHLERRIQRFTQDGIYTTFVGAAVTCAGVRRTSEDRYDPPALRVALPLVVGDSWTDETQTEDREESIAGRVIARERIRVPAGSFDTYRIEVTASLSGGQSGTFHAELWFSPALGTAVRERARTDVHASGAHFVSDITMTLRSLP